VDLVPVTFGLLHLPQPLPRHPAIPERPGVGGVELQCLVIGADGLTALLLLEEVVLGVVVRGPELGSQARTLA